MNINYGLLPPADGTPTHDAVGRRLKGKERGMAKRRAVSSRALQHLDDWLQNDRQRQHQPNLC